MLISSKIQPILFLAIFVQNALSIIRTPTLHLSVCCSPKVCNRAPSNAFHTLASAHQALHAARENGHNGETSIDIYGKCFERIVFSNIDGGLDESSRVTYNGIPGTNAGISAAKLLFPSDFSVIEDTYILAQLQPSSRQYVRQVNLTGIPINPPSCQPYVGGNSVMTPGLLQPAGAEFFAYGDPRVGGEASPLTPARYPNSALGGPMNSWATLFELNYTKVGSILGQLQVQDEEAAARSVLWQQQSIEDPGSIRGKYIGELGWLEHTQSLVSILSTMPPSAPPGVCTDVVTGYGVMGYDLAGTPFKGIESAGDCCALCGARTNCRFWSWAPPSLSNHGNCYLKYLNATGAWQRNPGIISGVTPTSFSTIDVSLGKQCAYVNEEDQYSNGAVILLSNLLAELDEPGEYTINRTSGVAYVWLPSLPTDWPSDTPWGTPWFEPPTSSKLSDDSPLAYVSMAPHAIDLNGTSFFTFNNLVIEGSQDAAVVARNATSVVFSNSRLQNAGNMVINVTRGNHVLIVNCTIRGGANGAALLEGGDRITLSPGNHSILNSSLSYSSRLVWLNAPMVSLDGVGLSIQDSGLVGGPHMGIYHSGNFHRIAGNIISHVVEACDDCGAVYGGRDWAYQGTHIINNTFRDLHSNEGLDVSSVYLDDMISGVIVNENVFENVSRALELGGGRWNSFARNVIRGLSLSNDAVVHFDNRGMNWANPSCNASQSQDPNMIMLLDRVPYNTSDVWISTFPALADILNDDPCRPKYNAIINNTYCQVMEGIPFIDATDEEIQSWDSVSYGNVNATSC
jgi:hypothetical protein